jgi:hypothetical protein
MKIESTNKDVKYNVAKAIALLYANDMPTYLIKKTVDALLWMCTENNNQGKKDKHLGQTYWSIEALYKFKKNIEEAVKSKNQFKGLRHEHSVPKKVIIACIDKSDKQCDSIYQILLNFAHAAIITEEEDSVLRGNGLLEKMAKPIENNSEMTNIFSRYIHAGIKICDVSSYDIKNLSDDDMNLLKTNTVT